VRNLDPLQLRDALIDARQRACMLLDDLDGARWQVPQLPIVNPPRWEFGHVAWFQEHWCLRGGDRRNSALLVEADRWYDSSVVPHAARWELPLPTRAATQAYAAEVLKRTLARLSAADHDDAALYPYRLSLYHEDMHVEAWVLMRQALGYPAPALPALAALGLPAVPQAQRDIAVDGNLFMLGRDGPGFSFDNEGEAHAVALAPYAISARPVSNAEFAAFVDDGGYRDARLWDGAAAAWRAESGAAHPLHWRRTDDGWQQRWFDRWLPLDPHAPVMQICAFEADAWCRWTGRRLPTEAEWECAVVRGLIRPFAADLPCWEWTATPFAPYPGFAPGPYRDYSAPWFGSHRVLRGASPATPVRLRDARFRNFYLPQRRDLLSGFRSCAS
jgi:iron(II)-dependent oxidoreductase